MIERWILERTDNLWGWMTGWLIGTVLWALFGPPSATFSGVSVEVGLLIWIALELVRRRPEPDAGGEG